LDSRRSNTFLEDLLLSMTGESFGFLTSGSKEASLLLVEDLWVLLVLLSRLSCELTLLLFPTAAGTLSGLDADLIGSLLESLLSFFFSLSELSFLSRFSLLGVSFLCSECLCLLCEDAVEDEETVLLLLPSFLCSFFECRLTSSLSLSLLLLELLVEELLLEDDSFLDLLLEDELLSLLIALQFSFFGTDLLAVVNGCWYCGLTGSGAASDSGDARAGDMEDSFSRPGSEEL
jgi:hypothetical protein